MKKEGPETKQQAWSTRSAVSTGRWALWKHHQPEGSWDSDVRLVQFHAALQVVTGMRACTGMEGHPLWLSWGHCSFKHWETEVFYDGIRSPNNKVGKKQPFLSLSLCLPALTRPEVFWAQCLTTVLYSTSCTPLSTTLSSSSIRTGLAYKPVSEQQGPRAWLHSSCFRTFISLLTRDPDGHWKQQSSSPPLLSCPSHKVPAIQVSCFRLGSRGEHSLKT